MRADSKQDTSSSSRGVRSRRSSRRVALSVSWLLLWLLLSASPALCQTADVMSRAREASAAGQRDEGLALLASHLAEQPRDVDARLLYGAMLSWEGRYDEARAELERVLAQAPGYLDARVALMNVEWWSGNGDAAREHARRILSEETGHPQASLVEQRLAASDRPWKATAAYTFDWFDGARDPWHETSLAISRETSLGSVIVRGSHAERFRIGDQLFELEAYPTFRAGTYAYLGVGVATKADLYPVYRVGMDVYQSLVWGLEASAGYRRLGFSDPADIFIGSLSKYLGNWMITAKISHVPADGPLDSTSYFGSVRRYFGEAGRSYVGLKYGHGLSREETRNASDLIDLDSDTLGAELSYESAAGWLVSLSAGSSRQERVFGDVLWQHTFGTSLGLRF